MTPPELTKREYFALEFAKAALQSNKNVHLTSEHLAHNAVEDADALLFRLSAITQEEAEAALKLANEPSLEKDILGEDGWYIRNPKAPIPQVDVVVELSSEHQPHVIGTYTRRAKDLHPDLWKHTKIVKVVKYRPAP